MGTYFGGEPSYHIRGEGTDGVLLIGGLGNNSEWWNWDTATELHNKTRWPAGPGIQTMLANRGIVSCSFDWGIAPDDPNEVMKRMRRMISQMNCKRVAVCGHSIGSRIALKLASEDNLPCVLIDPTPEFIMSRPRPPPKEQKHIESAKWFALLTSPWWDVDPRTLARAVVHYNIGDNPADDDEFEKSILAKYIKVTKYVNRTHWIYINQPHAIVDSIQHALAIV